MPFRPKRTQQQRPTKARRSQSELSDWPVIFQSEVLLANGLSSECLHADIYFFALMTHDVYLLMKSVICWWVCEGIECRTLSRERGN